MNGLSIFSTLLFAATTAPTIAKDDPILKTSETAEFILSACPKGLETKGVSLDEHPKLVDKNSKWRILHSSGYRYKKSEVHTVTLIPNSSTSNLSSCMVGDGTTEDQEHNPDFVKQWWSLISLISPDHDVEKIRNKERWSTKLFFSIPANDQVFSLLAIYKRKNDKQKHDRYLIGVIKEQME